MVEHVGAVGVIDDQFKLLRAGEIDGNRHGRVAAADRSAGETLLAVDQHAKDHAAAAGRGVVDAHEGLETTCPHPRPLSQRERRTGVPPVSEPGRLSPPSPKGRGEIRRQAGRRCGRRDPSRKAARRSGAGRRSRCGRAYGQAKSWDRLPTCPRRIEKRRLAVLGRLEVGEIRDAAADGLQKNEVPRAAANVWPAAVSLSDFPSTSSSVASSRLPSLKPAHACKGPVLAGRRFSAGLKRMAATRSVFTSTGPASVRSVTVSLAMPSNRPASSSPLSNSRRSDCGRPHPLPLSQRERGLSCCPSSQGERGDEAVEQLVAVPPAGGRMENDAGKRFQRDFLGAEQIGVGRQAVLVGGGDVGHEETAVGQHEPPCPALLRALAPADQIGRRHGPPLAIDEERDLPLGIDGRQFGVERGHRQARPRASRQAGPGARMQLQNNAKCNTARC